jgi:hypothetical protein
MDQQPKVIYRADTSAVESLRSLKKKLCDLCDAYTGRMVRVQTLDGVVYDGIIRHHEGCVLYLELSSPGYRAFWNPFLMFNPYSNLILPLVLYELLVISLLY